MKILLFGEYSGFFNCLKDGLVALGHEVFLASDGNSYRDYPSDFRWDAHTKDKLGKFRSFFFAGNIWWHKDLLKGFDIVFFVSPNNVSRFKALNGTIYDYLIKNNKLAYLSGSGNTCYVFDYWYNSNTKYRHYMEGYFQETPNPKWLNNQKLKAWETELMEKIEGYIPIWYEYAEPYRQFPNCKQTIRIPINLQQFEYKPNIVRDGKVVFYHGITRPCKGTRFIKPAFEKMQKHFGDKAEFICAEKLPFKEYMQVVEKTNVIVDDANSYSIAMNGLFSLQKGKLIMGGAEPIANKELGYEYNPVYNINPDVDQICETIIEIINHKDEIKERGRLGRKFVEEYHDSVKIAQQYIDLWEADLNKH